MTTVRFAYVATPCRVDIVADVAPTGAVRIRSAMWGNFSADEMVEPWFAGIKAAARKLAGVALGPGHTCDREPDEQPNCDDCECDHCPACPADCDAAPAAVAHFCDNTNPRDLVPSGLRESGRGRPVTPLSGSAPVRDQTKEMPR